MKSETIAEKAIRESEELFAQLNHKVREQNQTTAADQQKIWGDNTHLLMERFPGRKDSLLDVYEHGEAYVYAFRTFTFAANKEAYEKLVELSVAWALALTALLDSLLLKGGERYELHSQVSSFLAEAGLRAVKIYSAGAKIQLKIDEARRLNNRGRPTAARQLIPVLQGMIDEQLSLLSN